MLYMVIETFKSADPRPLGKRFQQCGRMQPEGLIYHASWLEPAGKRCFQLMETSQPELFQAWTSRWDDLMDFEIIPVLTSAEFWAQFKITPAG
ncbi:conserved hypothetical protein [Candidatus Sulfopaludibacter sp. SbA4]|nr:conserved hypothetical protein [Candidatus Sulfopaludibacter sp. SbA4]